MCPKRPQRHEIDGFWVRCLSDVAFHRDEDGNIIKNQIGFGIDLLAKIDLFCIRASTNGERTSQARSKVPDLKREINSQSIRNLIKLQNSSMSY